MSVLRFLQWLIARERLLRLASPLFGRFNPFLPQHRRDPHATWRALRSTEPVYRSRALGAWLLTRYDDVLHVLRDPNFTTDRSDVPLMKLVSRLTRKDPEFSAMIERNLLTLDGSDHTRLRGLVSKAFTPRRVERLRPQLEGIVDELLDRAAEASQMELIRDLAHPLPVIAIAELLGIPSADRARFRAWSADLVQLLDPLQGRGGSASLRRATHELYAYFRPLLAERRARPRDDLLSAMIAAEENGESLSETDLLALSGLLLVAGHETTANLIGNAVLALLRNPSERKRLQDDPDLIASAVEEFLRYDPPIQLTDRAVREDCEIGGRRIRKGQLVVVVLAAANRDPDRFPDPDRLDLGRTDHHHLAFGQGGHFCLGSQLAKLETEIAIGTLLRRFPDFFGNTEPTAWRRSMIIRGPEAVPLCLVPTC
ncbi:MAG: cytochrome P450 [Myxococcales bacterium]|nr:cytochrome P450 [Myxococcales bacterium]TDI96816.1 MAG: cytochrome P450 [Deltaproteobacteria bacterium]